MRTFDELVDEAETADVTGWDFGWFDGRASEQRPPWGYAWLLRERLASPDVTAALDIDTSGGEVFDEAAVLPPRTCATESWPPNARRARQRLGPRDVDVRETSPGAPLPFPDASFDLVAARHPVAPDWRELHRVLVPGGRYLAQHMGPGSAFELVEHFLGRQPEARRHRDPHAEVAAAQAAGLSPVDLRTARCRMELHDVGAVVWLLRRCVWWVPDFTVSRYRDRLLALDAGMRSGEPFVAHSTRHLIELRR